MTHRLSFSATPASIDEATTTAALLAVSSLGLTEEVTQDNGDQYNPDANIQTYLEEPTSVKVRGGTKMTGTVLVSGFLNARERTDQFIFDLLNHEDSAFDFTKIVAFVDDVKFAKKRLLSRSAR